MAIKLVYSDIAPGAAEAAQVSATGHSEDSISLLPTGGSIPKRITLEPNRWALDGTWGLDDSLPPLCSAVFSGADCALATVPEITVRFSAPVTAPGLSLTFAPDEGDRAGEVTVTWYAADDTVLRTVAEHPTSPELVIVAALTFSRVVISIPKSSLPYHRVRMSKIAFGISRSYGPSELRQVGTEQLVDVSGLTLEADTCDWTLDSADAALLAFQRRQPLDAYDGAAQVGAYYIERGKRLHARIYDVETCDLKGILAGEDAGPFIWTSPTAVGTILAAVLGSGYTVELDESFAGTTLSGYLPAGTRLELLRHILLAMGGVVDTTGRKISVRPPASGTAAVIPAARIDYGCDIDSDSELVTAVRLVSHSYAQAADGEIEVGGVRYHDTTAVTELVNPDATLSDAANVKEVADETLVSSANAAAVAARLLAYFRARRTFSGTITLAWEKPGDYVSLTTPWGETITGHITKMAVRYANTAKAEIEVSGA